MKIAIHQNPILKELHEFYSDQINNRSDYSTITDHLESFAIRMHEGVKLKRKDQFTELNNYHPNFIGKSVDELLTTTIELQDCYECIALQYGYTDWAECAQKGNVTYNHSFQNAVDAVIQGDLVLLENLLRNDPLLTQLTSQYGHQATLLHYTSSNGFELWRQQVPMNLKEIIQCLLDHGADLHALMKVYGGHFDTYSLFTTSAHPYRAGIGKEVELFLKAKLDQSTET